MLGQSRGLTVSQINGTGSVTSELPLQNLSPESELYETKPVIGSIVAALVLGQSRGLTVFADKWHWKRDLRVTASESCSVVRAV